MTTFPYSDLLAQVEALAGATLATPERSRVKIFANRRARKAHRECDYWPHLLHVGEERIVSEEGLLPLTQTGLQTIDKIIRIHAQDPFKSQAVYEYTEYYNDASGIQIAGYEKNEGQNSGRYLVSGAINPDYTGFWYDAGIANGYPAYTRDGELGVGAFTYKPTIYRFPSEEFYRMGTYPTTLLVDYFINDSLDGIDKGTWVAGINGTGVPVVTYDPDFTAFITYLAAIPATYGDGDGEESDVPEPWFEYMAQGAYTDWLRSDGQTEKAMAEEAIAESLLNQQLEKVSRSNGNQVVTRVMSHATKQAR
jgi:hypothetical protein